MPKYKLIYFKARGRAELARLLFAAADQAYEDVRLEGPQWAELKPKFQQGQLPILEIEGNDGKKKVIPQSMAIVRHLARAFRLYGKTPMEMTEIDMILETLGDMRTELISIYREIQKDPSKKEELEKKQRSEVIPKFLSLFDGIAKNNGGRGHYLVGDSLTVADLAVFDVFYHLKQKYDNVMDLTQYLKANYQRVCETGRIKVWVEKRPKTEV